MAYSNLQVTDEKNQTLTGVLQRLWRHISRRRKLQLGSLLVLIIVASFMEVFSLGALLPFLGVLVSPDQIFHHAKAKLFINVLGIHSPDELLKPITVMFIFAVLAAAGLRLVLMWANARLTFAVGADLGIEIYQRTLYQPYATHIARNSSEVIAGIATKSKALLYNAVLPVITILSSAVLILMIMIALISISPMISFIACGGLAVIYIGVVGYVRGRLRTDGYIISRESTYLIKALQEGLGGIRDVLIDGSQSQYCKIYREADLPLRKAQAHSNFIAFSPRIVIEALGVAFVSLLAYGLSRQSGGLITAVPVLGVLALGIQRLLPVVQNAYGAWVSLQGGIGSVSDALNLLDQPLPAYANQPRGKPLPFVHTLEIDNLWFKYESLGPWILEGICLTFNKGDRIGLIGTTGSGKSTLLDVLMGLLMPTNGFIKVDGVLLDEETIRAWQANIAHVPQHIFLADCSIEENIAFGVPVNEIDKDKVRAAARKAQIAGYIEAMPKAYKSIVGERGMRLSGGQRQRIGIARALYKEASVIIFDEATSALDGETETAVIEALKEIGSDITVFMIAHRLSTLAECNRIIELDSGKVKRMGSYEECC